MLAVAPVRDELRDHRVVVDRDLTALEHARVHAHHLVRVRVRVRVRIRVRVRVRVRVRFRVRGS